MQCLNLMSTIEFLANRRQKHLDDHARETDEGLSFDDRTNRFKNVLPGNDTYVERSELRLLEVQAIMMQSLEDLFYYDGEMFDEFLVIADKALKDRNS